jgi:hypothetical protein
VSQSCPQLHAASRFFMGFAFRSSIVGVGEKESLFFGTNHRSSPE